MIVFSLYTKEKKDFRVVLHSTTSFTNPGRVSDSFCERDSVITMMRSIEKTVLESFNFITIISLVKPGQTAPIDVAQLINQIKPDLALVFSAYKTEKSIPECGIYSYTWSPMTCGIKNDSLAFVPEADVYRISYDQTIAYAHAFEKKLSSSRHHWSQLFFSSFPIMPLRGFIVPALLIEIGLPDESMADSYGVLIGQVIAAIVGE